MSEYGEPLTEREKEILQMVATGVTNREVAFRLSISVNTVKVHLRNVYNKLGAESRTEATMIAVREGWVVVDDGSEPTISEEGTPAFAGCAGASPSLVQARDIDRRGAACGGRRSRDVAPQQFAGRQWGRPAV
jgi:DNA-binding CsgD family transcriptional regulator